ncbi:DUF2059 domain-containing protein [Erythrobacter cryptus]|uniref:DUF2059 domain-containing protein n=1 Tax=Erythrobacter cryptus TaxID=196588 RepID=UPI0004874113|nr:DUF2059 domain-containing protein [Erythrobacter cryptus]
MMRFFPSLRLPLAAALAAFAALGLPAPALAQGAPGAAAAEPQHPAYADLIATIEATVDQEQVIGNTVAALAQQFAAVPEFAAVEAASPGLIAEIAAGLRPVLAQQNRRVQALYRPQMIALVARHLTPAEAESVTAFYRSDLGRRLVGNVTSAYRPQATLSGVTAGQPITADQVRADIGNALASGVGQLSEEDLVAIGRAARDTPALLKLQQIGPEMQQIRVKMENEPLTAEENAAVAGVVERVFTSRFPAP